MKRTLRKVRAIVRRSAITKWLITFLLTGAGLLAIMVMGGESDPATTTFEEALMIRIYAAGVLAVDVLLWKIAYKQHLLMADFYEKERA